jgi:prepilin-type processing-associated H-X9-DG protein
LSYGGTPSTTSAFIYGRTMPFAMADGHVKSRPMGGTIGGRTDSHVDPFSEYTPSGYPYDFWMEENKCHALLFRPDFDFTNWGNPWESN